MAAEPGAAASSPAGNGPRAASGTRSARTAADQPVYAAVDLGTNNCRLLVAHAAGDSFRVIDSFSRIVRLGEGLQQSGRLGDPAINRTISAMRICAAKIARRGVTRLRAVATEACRLASNCDGFVARIAAETGVELEIISTAEEAALAVAGCAPLLHRTAPHALVFDIGGGSTEVMWLKVPPHGPPVTLGWTSVPWGVVKMAEAFGGETISVESYAAMRDTVLRHLEGFEATHGIAREVAAGRVQMLGTSGTVTTVAGIHLRLPYYRRDAVDGQHLDFSAIRRVSERLRASDLATRAAEPCIGNERADLVVSGCAILAAICELWPVGRLRVADRGVREGILFNLISADRAARMVETHAAD